MSQRYSIVPGDFARDARAKDVHRRVMGVLGTHSTRNGWVKLSQTLLARELGIARESVNRAVRDLVAWGYLDKRSQAETGRAICYYRIIMDRPGDPDEDVPDSQIEGVEEASGSGETCDVPLTPTCDVPGHTRVTSGVTHKGSPFSSSEERTPNPNGVSAVGGQVDLESVKAKAEAATLIADLKAAGAPGDVVEHLLRPILERRRFSARDRLERLRGLADLAKGIPTPALDRAAALVLDAGVLTVKPDRIAAAIARVRKAGAMVPVRRGTPQWAAWLRHLEATDPPQAKLMARYDGWQVRAEWPPASSPHAAVGSSGGGAQSSAAPADRAVAVGSDPTRGAA